MDTLAGFHTGFFCKGINSDLAVLKHGSLEGSGAFFHSLSLILIPF